MKTGETVKMQISANHDAFCQVLLSFYGRKIEDAPPCTRPGEPFALFHRGGRGCGAESIEKLNDRRRVGERRIEQRVLFFMVGHGIISSVLNGKLKLKKWTESESIWQE